jgi:GNAT superfamily N-acetyltransferase
LWSWQEYERRLQAQGRSLLVQVVGWEGDDPVGRGHLLFPGHPEWSISAHRWGCLEVRDVMVLPEHRRRGAATSIMSALEGAARERDASRVGLAVAMDEEAAPARALYEKLAYRFAHGPFIGSTKIQTDDGPRPVGAVFVYLTKEL